MIEQLLSSGLIAPPTRLACWSRGRRIPGHEYNREALRLEPPGPRRRYVPSIERGIARLRDPRTFERREQYFPDLFGHCDNLPDRQYVREDFAEALFRTLAFLLGHVDLRTRKVKLRKEDGDHDMDLAQLASGAGCAFTPACERRRSEAPVQIERLIGVLVDVDYVFRLEKRVLKDDGTYESHVAETWLTKRGMDCLVAPLARDRDLAHKDFIATGVAASEARYARDAAATRQDKEGWRKSRRSWRKAPRRGKPPDPPPT